MRARERREDEVEVEKDKGVVVVVAARRRIIVVVLPLSPSVPLFSLPFQSLSPSPDVQGRHLCEAHAWERAGKKMVKRLKTKHKDRGAKIFFRLRRSSTLTVDAAA